MKRSLFILLLLLTLFMIVPMHVLGQSNSDTIILRSGGDISIFNPLLWTDSGSAAAGVLIWPTIFDTDRFTGLPLPGLTTWEISEDGLTYTFTIREDANWSDGTPITANDVKFAIDAVKSDLVESPRKGNVESIAAVNVIDDKTVEIVLSEVYCTLWQDLGVIYLLPSHRFAPDFSDFMTNPLNTDPDISGGPYLFLEWQPDEFSRFQANPDFWKGEPTIPFVINRVIEDNAVVLQALQAGELDYMVLPGDQFEQLSQKENFNYFAFSQGNVGFMALNWADPTNPQPAYDENGNLVEQTPHPIFSDVKVRQAVAMGYDKSAIIDTLGENGAIQLASSVVPTISWAINENVEPWPYDPEAAAALLDEAGWVDEDGDGIRECHGCATAEEGTPLKFEIAYSAFFAYFETAALIAQDQLSQLGMDISLKQLEWGAYLNDVLLAQTFDATPISFGGGSDPDGVASAITSARNDIPGGGFNITSYVNPEYDQLLEQARTVPGCSQEDRKALYDEIQRIQHEDVAYDFYISPNFFYVMNKRVENFNPGPWGGITPLLQELVIAG